MQKILEDALKIILLVLILGSSFYIYQNSVDDKVLIEKKQDIEKSSTTTITEQIKQNLPSSTTPKVEKQVLQTKAKAEITSVETTETEPQVKVDNAMQIDEASVINSVKAIYSAILSYEKDTFEKTGKLPSYQFKIKIGGLWGTTVPTNATLDTLGIRNLLSKHASSYPTLLLELNAPAPNMGFAIVTKLPDGKQYCIDHNNFSGKGAFDIFDGWCKQ